LAGKALNKYEGTEFRIYVFDVTSWNEEFYEQAIKFRIQEILEILRKSIINCQWIYKYDVSE
jgi:hypothetical protein